MSTRRRRMKPSSVMDLAPLIGSPPAPAVHFQRIRRRLGRRRDHRRLPPDLVADAYPTLGPRLGLSGVLCGGRPRAHLASEGSRVARGTVAKDIASGGLAPCCPASASCGDIRKAYDHVVVIGDFIGVAGCWLARHHRITYLDVYKTGYGRPYAGLEAWIIRRTAGASSTAARSSPTRWWQGASTRSPPAMS